MFLSLTFLLLLCGFLFFYHLGERDLWSSHEGRAAQNAQSILKEGCWGLPHLFDGHVELQKPPLYYWLVALLARCRDGHVDGWTVRLPAALSAAGCVLLLFLFGHIRRRPLAGVIAAATLATMLHFTSMARTGRIDMPLTFAVTLALVGFYQGRKFFLLLAYLAVAAALMLKGPIGLVLPAAVIVAYLLLERLEAGGRRPEVKCTQHSALSTQHSALILHNSKLKTQNSKLSSLWWGIPLVLALAAPWYIWAEIQTHGELHRRFLWYHNIERAFGGSETLRAHPWWFYVPRLAADLLPWSLLLPAAGWYLLRRKRWRRDGLARFGLVWLLTMLAVLSCARFKRADYLLPAYPGAALLLGCVGERWYRGLRRLASGGRQLHVDENINQKHGAYAPRSPILSASAFLFLIFSCAAGWWVYVDHILPREEPTHEQRRFASAIRNLEPAPGLVILFRVESHALAFHLGGPLNTILEWENIDIWAGRPGTHYIVMPPDCARDWQKYVTSGRLEEVLCNEDLSGCPHEQPLVLLRTIPGK